MQLWPKLIFPTCGGRAKSPAKSQRMVLLKDKLRFGRSIYPIGLCVSRFPAERIYPAKCRKIGVEARRQILQTHIAAEKNSGKEGSIQRGHSEAREPHERSLCAPKYEERSREISSQQERCARKAEWNLAKNVYDFKKCGQNHVLLSNWSYGNAGTHFKLTREKRIRDWIRSFNGHAEQKRFEEYSEEIQKPLL